jgi:hypothetical protein
MALLLAVIFTCGLMPFISVRAAAPQMTLTASKDEVNVGESYTIALSVDSPFAAADATVTYDKALAAYTGGDSPPGLDGLLILHDAANGEIRLTRFGGERGYVLSQSKA